MYTRGHIPELTQGLLAAWLRCRREARLFLEGWTPHQEKEAMEYGGLAHQVLAHGYSRLRARGRLGNVRKWTGTQCQLWQHQHGGTWSASRVATHELHTAQLETLIPRYYEYWTQHDVGKVRWAAPEQTFRISHGAYTLRGRIDGALWLGKQLWLFETKNWGFIPEASLVHTLGYDLQLNFYCLALASMLSTVPRGAVLNVVRRPQIAVGKKGLADYAQRLATAIDRDPGHYFMRFDITMTKHAQTLFADELETILEEFAAWNRGGRAGVRFGMPCSVRGSLCKYVPLCHHGIASAYYKRAVLYPELEEV